MAVSACARTTVRSDYADFGKTVLVPKAAAGVDMALVCELPILHLAGVAQRVFELKQGGGKQYRPMAAQDRAALYPRRSKKRTRPD